MVESPVVSHNVLVWLELSHTIYLPDEQISISSTSESMNGLLQSKKFTRSGYKNISLQIN